MSWHGETRDYSYSDLRVKCKEMGATYCKMACPTNTIEDIFYLVDMMPRDSFSKPYPALLGMGDMGAITRILLPWLGSSMVYGFYRQSAVVTGQVSLSILDKCFSHIMTNKRNIGVLLKAIGILQTSPNLVNIDWDLIKSALRDRLGE